jgi:phage/plasmid-associated DNA primase
LAEEGADPEATTKARKEEKQAKAYHKFVLARRKSSNLSATLTEAGPLLQVDISDLDAHPFLLNTPAGEVDLTTGALLPHDPANLHTRMTAVGPGEEGAELWAAFLATVTCGDWALGEYLQLLSGQEAIGKVFCENLEILYGEGRNGKSTYVNTKMQCLGDYAGTLSAETLTVQGTMRNKNPEYAELRGKRLVVAAELEEGRRLDTAVVKRLCSTDMIHAEKKYRDPFYFTPSHTAILFTTYLLRENPETTVAAAAAFSVSWCRAGMANLTLSPV